ncbi:MAG TPA: hypothetical protein VFT00_08330 [Nocardioides sp.]|nr:hypothetical protein [Nocardioides sp.]
MRRILGLLVWMVPLALVAVPAPAYASCAADSGPEGSPVVFVGTAQEERRGFTRFEVEEVWAGPDLADEVWVLSGQEQPPFPLNMFSAVSSSVDAEFIDGDRYVVGASDDFRTGACSVSEATADLDSLRPDDARSPVDGGATGADPPLGPWTIGLMGAGAGVLVALAVAVRRHRRAAG